MENHQCSWVNQLFLWPCSISMWNYQRVNPHSIPFSQSHQNPINGPFSIAIVTLPEGKSTCLSYQNFAEGSQTHGLRGGFQLVRCPPAQVALIIAVEGLHVVGWVVNGPRRTRVSWGTRRRMCTESGLEHVGIIVKGNWIEVREKLTAKRIK